MKITDEVFQLLFRIQSCLTSNFNHISISEDFQNKIIANKVSINDNEMLETESVTTLDPFKQFSTHSASPLKQTLMQDESDESHSLMHSYTSSAHCLSHCSFEFEFLKSIFSCLVDCAV